MSTTSLLTRETAGVFAAVKDFPLTNEEVDTNWLTLAENKLEKSFNLSDLTDVVEARINLGLGGIESMAIQSDDDVSITGGSISGVDLQFTARTLWGQSFDGSNNVNGNIVGAGTIQFGTQSSKATLTYTTNTVRTLTVPALSGNRTFAFINESQTFSTDQIFSTNVRVNSLGVGVAADGTAGNATFTGSVNASNATFTGSVNASNATFTGSVIVNNNTRVNSLGVGVAASSTEGEIRATNQITAFFSDERLKQDIVQIENALEKVISLSGVTYHINELAESFGFSKNEKGYVGVIAQQVEKVLPQAIFPAPFDLNEKNESISGENYKTVQYEKLVPLLIEAIKDINDKIEEILSRGNN